MTRPAQFSIVMATHERPQLLERALRSVRAQSVGDVEVIVVADTADADTARVASATLGPRDIFVKRNGAPGPADSRNLGLDMARGEWVIFLDDDDTLAPHHLASLQPHLRGDAGVLFGDCRVVTEDRSRDDIPTLSQAELALVGNDVGTLWVKNFIPLHCLAYRRPVLDGCRFDPHLSSLEDWDFLLSVCAREMPRGVPGGGAIMHKDYVNPGIRRGTQTSANDNTVVLDFLHIYRRWPAPDDTRRAQRQALIKSVGLDLPVAWF